MLTLVSLEFSRSLFFFLSFFLFFLSFLSVFFFAFCLRFFFFETINLQGARNALIYGARVRFKNPSISFFYFFLFFLFFCFFFFSFVLLSERQFFFFPSPFLSFRICSKVIASKRKEGDRKKGGGKLVLLFKD